MKHLLAYILALVLFASCSSGFERNFYEDTLKIDLQVIENHDRCKVKIDSISQWPGWYGRRVNMTQELYPESMQIVVIDCVTGDTLYVDSKSPNVLAQDGKNAPAYIQMFVPKPKHDCKIVATVYSFKKGAIVVDGTATINLSTDQLSSMHSKKVATVTPHRTLRYASDPKHCINLAIVAEGYTANEADSFYLRAAQLDEALFAQPGFKDYADAFNVVAVMIPSDESGITEPVNGKVVNSALGAHFDSFGLDRLITLDDTRGLWNALEGIPASKILILANTPRYGGSGAYNEYAIASANIPNFAEVLIHEFGHSFAWLGDEYESGYYEQYPPDIEPMEPNITTLHDFSSKWQNLIDSGEASLIEGAGYQEKWVWRGCENCLMRAIEDEQFCPVCAQALSRIIKYHIQDLSEKQPGL